MQEAQETKLKNQVRGEALASAASHKTDQKAADVSYECVSSSLSLSPFSALPVLIRSLLLELTSTP